MLILSRRYGERILIGDDIVITITGIDRGKVAVGVQAPPATRIYREEVLSRPRTPRTDMEGVA